MQGQLSKMLKIVLNEETYMQKALYDRLSLAI